MNKKSSQNALLVEIMIAVLFFSLCATVMLETFVAAREFSRRSEAESLAIAGMQDITERLYAADDMEKMLEEAGFTENSDIWTFECDKYRLELVIEEEQTSAGIMKKTLITAFRDEKVIAELPGARYLPGGGL